MPAEKIRVLIVDDIAETRENVRKLLQFEPDVEVVGAARSGKEGIQLALELDPDVVLMDINMPDIDGITATETIRHKSPHIQVVILSVQNDQNYMRRAMLAGARDFLTKPPMGDELISAIRRASEMARIERSKNVGGRGATAMTGLPTSVPTLPGLLQGKVVTVYSPKGGVGTTTLAVNLAIALHNEDTRVVLVDSNLQFGDVAVFINEQGKNTLIEIAPRIEELDSEIIEDIMIKHQASGIHVLTAPPKPEYAEKVTADQFERVIHLLKQLYAYVVIDTSSTLTDIALATIDRSDVVVVVTTQEIPSIKNVSLCLDLFHTLGVQKDRIVLAMNRFDKRIAITPERVGKNLKQDVAAVVPLDERIVINAVNRGIPFMVDNKNQLVGRGMYSLAEAVRSRIAALEAEDEKLPTSGRR
ncbi:MAG: response regulator [Chloroflexi bacterium]|nr:response regulator [Chloroflexota bacterium]